jgi:hypothetical protein
VPWGFSSEFSTELSKKAHKFPWRTAFAHKKKYMENRILTLLIKLGQVAWLERGDSFLRLEEECYHVVAKKKECYHDSQFIS